MLNRRQILQAMALGAAGLTYPGRKAFSAAATSGPKRIIFFYHPNGSPGGHNFADYWCKSGSGGPTDFTPTGMTAPLTRHKAQMVYFENLSIMSASTLWHGGEVHEDGMAQMLTNYQTTGYKSSHPLGESLDNHLATTIGAKTNPSWPMINLGISTEEVGYHNMSMSFLPNGTQIPTNRDPLKAYNALFGSYNVAPASTRIARRKSVLDGIAAELTAFQKTLPAEDKARADAQLAAVRALEQRLVPPTQTCKAPAAPSSLNLDDGHNATLLANQQFDLVTAAFACDITRIASIVYGGSFSGTVHNGLIGGYDEDMHGVSHHENTADIMAAKIPVFTLLAGLVDRLKAIPEGTGTMLDNTLIVVVSEIGEWHDHDKMPWLTIGGANMGVNVNSYIKLPSLGQSPDQVDGYHHGRLLRSLRMAMGGPDAPFGDPNYSSTSLPGFLR